MKKMLSILALSAFIAVGFTGCGGEAPKKEADKKGGTPAPAAPTGGKEAAKEAPKK